MNFTSTDNLKLQFQEYKTENGTAILLIVHGLGEHGARYKHVASFFNARGISVITLDLRGHGKSEGKRGYVPKFESFLEDLDLMIKWIKENYPSIPLFLYGHSMGGCIVLSYLVNKKPVLQGVIATSAFITLSFQPNVLLLTLGKIMNLIYPAFTQANQLLVEHISRDPKVVEAYKNDPLVHQQLSSALGIGMLEEGKRLSEFKGNIETPLLLTHGTADKITSMEGSKMFFEHTTGDRTLKLWEGLYHETHNEPEQNEVLLYTYQWIKKYL
ncbi:MAG: alpha/beta hydrolase [Saprospiraceae bacterium]